MKSVLFAVKSSEIDNAVLEAFETKMMEHLRTSSRDYEDAVGNHCDYREGLLSACNQFRPDVLIINEELTGNGDITDVIKSIRSQYPSLLVIVLLTQDRTIGDARLAKLAAMGIYNWLAPPWKVPPIAKMITNPRTMQDVDAYMPKIIEGRDGMIVGPKIADPSVKPLNNLEDLDDVNVVVNKPSGQNYVSAGDVKDINDNPVNNESKSYQKVINGGFNFMGGVKPHYEEPPKPVEVSHTVTPQPIAPVQEPTKVAKQPQTPKVEEPKVVETKVEPVKSAEPSVAEQSEEEKNRKLEEAIRKMHARPSYKDVQNEMEQAVKETEEKETPQVKEEPKKESEKQIAPKQPAIDEEKTSVLDSIKIEEIKHSEVKKEEVKEQVKPKEEKPVKAEPVKTVEPAKDKKLVDVSKIKLPRAKKILFLHAAPVTSSLAVQIAYFLKKRGSKVTFVDLNKKSALKPFYKEDNSLNGIKTIHSDFKGYEPVENEYVIADAVAGNGIDRIIPMFDHVTVVIPSDLNVLRTFTERYRSLLGSFGIAVDKAFAGSYGPKQFKEICNGPKYCELIRVNPQEKDSDAFSYKDVLDAEANGDSLVDNDEYVATLRFLLEGIK